MAFLDTAINVNDLPQSEQGNFEPIPAGWYTASIAGAELKDTKAGNGKYINVRYDITGPSHEGRVVFGMLNIQNPNPKAEEIGRQQLGELMRAIGLNQVTDTDQLIGGKCSIKVAIKPAQNGYEPSNDIKAWKAQEGAMPKPEAAPQAEKPAAAAPPWAK